VITSPSPYVRKQPRFTMITVGLIFLLGAISEFHILNAQQTSKTPASNKSQSSSISATNELFRAAIQDPFNQTSLKALEDSLPHVGDFIVVEGDTLVTASEFQAFISNLGRQTSDDRSRELLVKTQPDGSLDYYSNPNERQIHYSIDKASFPTPQEYQLVVSSMQQATSEWTQICPECRITFSYDAGSDIKPSIAAGAFVVRYFDAHGAYVAASFFPHDAPLRRYLSVDPSYFSQTSFDKTGILRHELGHILGYRHEHIRGISGCGFEDGAWKPLTPYDSHSVMHYFCGGGGTLGLQITAVDIAGHKKLYGPSHPDLPSNTPTAQTSSLDGKDLPPNVEKPKKGTLIIRVEGGDVTKHAAEALTLLLNEHLLPTQRTPIKQGDSIAEFYLRALNLPGSDDKLEDIARSLNPTIRHFHRLSPSETIVYPDVKFSNYTFSSQFDPSVPSDLSKSKNWAYLEVEGDSKQAGGKLRYKGYECRIELPLSDAAKMAAGINSLQHKNLLATFQDLSQTPHYFSVTDGNERLSSLRDVNHPPPPHEEMDLRRLIRLQPSGSYACQTGASSTGPPIVLIDLPVLHHPELEGQVDPFIGDTLPDPEVLPDGSIIIHANFPFLPSRDHGTHMAGILVAKKNDYGIVGINPGSHLESWNWNDLSSPVTRLADALEERAQKSGTPIFVFASEWNPTDQQRAVNSRLENGNALWIVAAGEPKVKGADPLDITDDKTHLPMGLGQRPYVIAVTACEACYSAESRLADYANYSSNSYVQVAAPGNSILSTVSSGEYDEASGTSQATAITAGLVSAMVQCWPGYFQGQPGKIKFRLQITSWPGLKRDLNNVDKDSIDKVTAGVIDGRVAILNPELSWILLPSADSVEGAYKTVTINNWCVDALTLIRKEDHEAVGTIDVKRIARIVKVNDQWFVFGKAAARGGLRPHIDAIERIGPGIIGEVEDQKTLLSTSIGTLSLAQINDLLLGQSRDYGKCGDNR